MRPLRKLRTRRGGAMLRQPTCSCHSQRIPAQNGSACRQNFGKQSMAFFDNSLLVALLGSLILVMACTWWIVRG